MWRPRLEWTRREGSEGVGARNKEGGTKSKLPQIPLLTGSDPSLRTGPPRSTLHLGFRNWLLMTFIIVLLKTLAGTSENFRV